MKTGEKALALSKALRESGLYPGPAVHEFLQGRGYTPEDILARGGWVQILMGMVPDEYQTIKELIEAIKVHAAR